MNSLNILIIVLLNSLSVISPTWLSLGTITTELVIMKVGVNIFLFLLKFHFAFVLFYKDCTSGICSLLDYFGICFRSNCIDGYLHLGLVAFD